MTQPKRAMLGFVLGAAWLVQGCGSDTSESCSQESDYVSTLSSRGAIEFACAAPKLEIEKSAPWTYHVSGCGCEADYVCHGTCIFNSEHPTSFPVVCSREPLIHPCPAASEGDAGVD
jgi:hypothetical protein